MWMGLTVCVFFCLQRKIFLFSTVFTLSCSLFSLFPCCWFDEASWALPKDTVCCFFHEEKTKRANGKFHESENFFTFSAFSLATKKSDQTHSHDSREKLHAFNLLYPRRIELSVKIANKCPRFVASVNIVFIVLEASSPSSTESWNECIIASYFWLKSPDSEAFELAMAEEKKRMNFSSFLCWIRIIRLSHKSTHIDDKLQSEILINMSHVNSYISLRKLCLLDMKWKRQNYFSISLKCVYHMMAHWKLFPINCTYWMADNCQWKIEKLKYNTCQFRSDCTTDLAVYFSIEIIKMISSYLLFMLEWNLQSVFVKMENAARHDGLTAHGNIYRSWNQL